MWSNVIHLLKFAILYSLIGQCSSSIFLNFGDKSVREEHNRLMSSNVHRGIILSLSPEQRNEMCADFYSIQLYTNTNVASQRGGGRDADNPFQVTHRWLTQEEATGKADADESPFEEPGLVLVCVARGITSRIPPKRMNSVSSAFRTKWFYVTQTYRRVGDPYAQYVTNFVVFSPDHVDLSQAELEKRYRNVRETMTTLRAESPKYVELIEKRDNLSNLSKKQKLNLCACILSSPAYRRDRLEYSLDWIKEMYEKEALEYEEVRVSFDGTTDKLPTDGILCKAFEDGTTTKSESTSMYLTRSYADGYSAVVLKEKSEGTFVDKYFENIAELITAQENMNYDDLFLNIRPSELQN